MSIKHSYVPTVADPADSDLVGTTKWNAAHTIDDDTVTSAKLVSVAAAKVEHGTALQTLRTNADGDAVEWGIAIHVGTSAPASPSVDDIWVDTTV